MRDRDDPSDEWPMAKISPEFADRLGQLGSDRKVRVTVLLDIGHSSGPSRRRRSPTGREAEVEAVRQRARAALSEIDGILERSGGHLLTRDADALGSVPVEATVAGVRALATSERVKAILEDAPLVAQST